MGGERAHFEDLRIGSTAPVVEHRLTRTDLVRYAGASGDYNPMHHDEPRAQEAGMPSVFGHGMLSMAIVGRALTDWLGADAVTDFGVRFARQTWPGDTLATAVEVTALPAPGVVELDCRLLNQDGDAVVTGRATARVPLRTEGATAPGSAGTGSADDGAMGGDGGR